MISSPRCRCLVWSLYVRVKGRLDFLYEKSQHAACLRSWPYFHSNIDCTENRQPAWGNFVLPAVTKFNYHIPAVGKNLILETSLTDPSVILLIDRWFCHRAGDFKNICTWKEACRLLPQQLWKGLGDPKSGSEVWCERQEEGKTGLPLMVLILQG